MARQTHWHYLGRDSKRLRNTSMECLCVTWKVRYNWLDSTTYVWRCVTQCLLPAVLYPLTLLRSRLFNFCEELRAYRFVIHHIRSLGLQNIASSPYSRKRARLRAWLVMNLTEAILLCSNKFIKLYWCIVVYWRYNTLYKFVTTQRDGLCHIAKLRVLYLSL